MSASAWATKQHETTFLMRKKRKENSKPYKAYWTAESEAVNHMRKREGGAWECVRKCIASDCVCVNKWMSECEHETVGNEITWTRSNIEQCSVFRFIFGQCLCMWDFFLCLLRTYSCMHCNCTASVYFNRLCSLYILYLTQCTHIYMMVFSFFVYFFSSLRFVVSNCVISSS